MNATFPRFAVIFLFAFSLLLVHGHAAQTTWQGTGDLASTPENWSDGLPTAETDVVIGNAGFERIRGSFSTRDVSFTRTEGSFDIAAVGSGSTQTYASLTTAFGASTLVLRNHDGNSGNGRPLNLLIVGDFNANSTVGFGSTSTTSLQGAIYNFNVGGTTHLNSGGVINFSRLQNTLHAQDGNFYLGTLNMNGGTLNMTSAGSQTALENTVSVARINGTTGVIRANQASTSAELRINSDSEVGAGSTSVGIANGASGAVVRLTMTGTSSQELLGASTFSGGTTLSGGLLIAGHNSALGTGGVTVSGANSATLRVAEGVSLANAVTFSNNHASSAVERLLDETHAFSTGVGSLTSGFDNGRSISVAFRGGEASSATMLSLGFSANSIAVNDEQRLSDVLRLNGTGADIFVLEITAAHLGEGAYFLGWNDNEEWVNAILGNSALGESAIQNFVGSFAASGALADAAYLGSWGYDDSTGAAWAILDHNSEFAVMIPEPAWIGALLGVAALVLVIRRSRR